MGVRCLAERLQAAGLRHRVRIQEQQQRRRRGGGAGVAAGAEALVLTLRDRVYAGAGGQLGAAVGRGVVDDHELVVRLELVAERAEQHRQVSRRVVAHDDDGQRVGTGHYSWSSAAG